MIDIDREVRDSLTRQSANAPDGADLLAGVRTRSRRYAVRRRLVAGGLAASVAALVAVPLLALDRGAATLQPADAPNRIELVAATPSADRFPLTPGWLPDGLLPAQVIRFSGDEVVLEYHAEAEPSQPAIVVNVSSSDISKYEVAGDQVKYGRRPTDVGGKPAELLTVPEASDVTALTFQRAPRQWVFVTAHRGIGTDAVLRKIAAELRDQPVAGTMPFEFTLAPKGFTLSQSSVAGAEFQPSAGGSVEDAILVSVESTAPTQPMPDRTKINYGSADGRQLADVPLDGGMVLRISGPAEPVLSRRDFRRFVEGASVRPGFVTAGG